MVPYVEQVIEDFMEPITSSSATPATENLFKVREDSQKKVLPEEQAVAFHHTTAQLLFALTRVRRDIQTPVSFLCSRVKEPDEDDWGKLKRVLKYRRDTL